MPVGDSRRFETFHLEVCVDLVLLPIEESASVLSRHRTKLYDLISQGVIPTIHIRSVVRIPTEARRDFVQVRHGESERAAARRPSDEKRPGGNLASWGAARASARVAAPTRYQRADTGAVLFSPCRQSHATPKGMA